jgi:hypothetical protein
MVPVMIGSGANLLGYYMFQGGENPDGKLGPLNESKSTGYPSDLPVKNYDFLAPLSAFGRERPSFGALKLFNYFANDFGTELAPMAVHAPAVLPAGRTDTTTVRVAARTHGDSGFLFLDNHVRGLGINKCKYDCSCPPVRCLFLAAPSTCPRIVISFGQSIWTSMVYACATAPLSRFAAWKGDELYSMFSSQYRESAPSLPSRPMRSHQFK